MEDDNHFYVEIICSDPAILEHAEQYIKSYLEPKHIRSINALSQQKQKSYDDFLLNRLMREYVVHIDVECSDQLDRIIFYSLTLTVLYLAIDDFVKSTSSVGQPNSVMFEDAQSVLRSLSLTFEQEWVDCNQEDLSNKNGLDKAQSISLRNDVSPDEMDSQVYSSSRITTAQNMGPPLKTSFPGAEKPARKVEIKDFVVAGKKKSKSNKASANKHVSATFDNELIREMRKKLQGRNLRHVIIDGANIGRTFGNSEFSSRGVKIAVDLFQSYGYPDSKIIVIIPPHYLSKDKDGIFPDLIRRKILHQSFHQVIDNEKKRFYDDRLIVDLAVMRNGIILSNDFYRDLMKDSGDAVKKAIRERLLCYRFIGDDLCLPNPVSEGGPSLDNFLTL